VRRELYTESNAELPPPETGFRSRFQSLPGQDNGIPEAGGRKKQASIPPNPEQDLLWFIAHYAPDLEDWERDIFLAVREESYYFYPVFACQIMNEGWACHWHATLLREADFLSQGDYIDAIKTHSDVVRPHAAGSQVSLNPNPYHLGFCIWERIFEEQGPERAFEIRAQDDDFSFIRNYLTEDLAKELSLFQYVAKKDGSVDVVDMNIHEIREAILASKFNFGAPTVLAKNVDVDGTLHLLHDHKTDGRGLDIKRTEKVLEYVQQVWRRTVKLDTVDARGTARTLSVTC
jgi:stage V sporulation protein R